MSTKKKIGLFLLYAFILVTICTVYMIIEASPPSGSDINLITRRIETPLKLWLNGYLGVFFNFMYMGVFNWMLIFLLPAFIIQKRPFIRKYYAMLFYLSAAVALIGAKGYFNERYQLTLLPLLIFLVIYIYGNILDKKKHSFTIKFLMAVLISSFGVYFFNGFIEKYGSRIVRVVNSESEINLSESYNSDEFINKMKANRLFLVNNLSEFYYNTDKAGVYFNSTLGNLYLKNEIKKIPTFDQNFYHYLKDTLGCSYVYSSVGMNEINHKFDNFLKNYCIVLKEDQRGLIVYQLK